MILQLRKIISLTLFFSFILSQGVNAQPVDACITANSIPVNNTNRIRTVCPKTLINLYVSNCSSTPPVGGSYTYSWEKFQNGTWIQGWNVPNVQAADSGMWVGTVTHINGVTVTTDKDTIFIRYYAVPPMSINGNAALVPYCKEEGTKTLTATNNATFSTHQWFLGITPTLPAEFTGNPYIIDVSNLNSSTFVTVVVQESTFGCILTDDIYLGKRPDSQKPNLGTDKFACLGQTVALTDPTLPTGGSNWFIWTPGPSGASANVNSVTSSGQYILAYTAGAANCPSYDTVNVTINPLPVVSAGLDTSICYGTSVQLNATVSSGPTPHAFSWSPAATLSAANIANPVSTPTTASTTYTVTLTDGNNCQNTSNVTVTRQPQLVTSVAFTDSTICKFTNLTLLSSASGCTGAYNFSWTPSTSLSNASIANPVASPLSNTSYTVTVTDAKNCSDAKTVNVNVAFPIAEFGSDQMSSVGNTPITLDPASTTAVSYLWTNVTTGATLGNSTTLTVDSSGKYAVLVQDINGCTNSDTVTVFFVEGSPYVIYVPNVFSPSHSDPDNRALKVYGNLIKTNDFSFRIYNKWGDLIYETKDFSEANSIGWTGDMASSQQQMNVFTYTVKGEFFDGTPFEKVGTATLIK